MQAYMEIAFDTSYGRQAHKQASTTADDTDGSLITAGGTQYRSQDSALRANGNSNSPRITRYERNEISKKATNIFNKYHFATYYFFHLTPFLLTFVI